MRKPAYLALLLSFALLAKALIPAGWLPSDKGAFEITVCTGMGTDSLWLDHDGNLHKQKPASTHDEAGAEPCPYAALVAVANLPDMATVPTRFRAETDLIEMRLPTATIGRGLAAPPPPSTGPPQLS